jgi:hypothetical protein
MTLCVFAASSSGAIADYPRADAFGAHISKATISHGRVTVSATFHRTHRFFAQVYAHPKNPRQIRWVRTVALGEHHKGPGHVSFRLGTLTPGDYGILILPTRATYPWLSMPTGGAQTTTWLGVTVATTGQVIAVRPQQPA